MQFLRIDESSPYRQLVGVGGLGTGIFFALEGDQTLGRSESRGGRLLDIKDYCKLHIVIHYVAKLLGARPSGGPFHVLPVGCVGDDAPGRNVVEAMADAGIDTSHIQLTPTAPTLFSVCFQYPDGSGGNITTNNSAAATLESEDVEQISAWMALRDKRTVALAVPEVPLEVRRLFLEKASEAGAFCAASFVASEVKAAREFGMFEHLDLVALNQSEAEEFLGRKFIPESTLTFVDDCRTLLKRSYPRLRLVVTMGSLGAYAMTAEASDFCTAEKVEVASTAGAGDSLLGGILAALAAGIPLMRKSAGGQSEQHKVIESALQVGVLLASFKCQSPHTISPDASIDTLAVFARNRGFSFCRDIESLFTGEIGNPTPAIRG